MLRPEFGISMLIIRPSKCGLRLVDKASVDRIDNAKGEFAKEDNVLVCETLTN